MEQTLTQSHCTHILLTDHVTPNHWWVFESLGTSRSLPTQTLNKQNQLIAQLQTANSSHWNSLAWLPALCDEHRILKTTDNAGFGGNLETLSKCRIAQSLGVLLLSELCNWACSACLRVCVGRDLEVPNDSKKTHSVILCYMVSQYVCGCSGIVSGLFHIKSYLPSQSRIFWAKLTLSGLSKAWAHAHSILISNSAQGCSIRAAI